MLISSMFAEIIVGRFIMSENSTKDYANVGPTLLAVTWVLFAISFVVVCLRFYADLFIIHSVRKDTYIAFFIFVCIQSSKSA